MQGDTEKVALGEGTGGSRSASLGGSAVHLATEKIVTKAKAIAGRLHAGADAEGIRFDDGLFSAPRSNRCTTVGEIAEGLVRRGRDRLLAPRPSRRRAGRGGFGRHAVRRHHS